MPSVYVSGEFKAVVALKADDDFLLEQWTDKKLAARRSEYGRSNLGFWLNIENKEDPISPFAIPVEVENVYEGSFTADGKDNIFTFSFNGKAKASVHKLTKEAVDKGLVAVLESVSINGQGYIVPEDTKANFLVRSKKI